jgi:hypothetical protein
MFSNMCLFFVRFWSPYFVLIVIVHSLCFVFIGLFCGKDLTHPVVISLFILYATCANYVYNVLIQGAVGKNQTENILMYKKKDQC